ncbi:hypothetical protein Mapa_009571 [Marchantia paleacea]|nr:hypothetical protein Mapa_009571 [Marchantia paleacea]
MSACFFFSVLTCRRFEKSVYCAEIRKLASMARLRLDMQGHCIKICDVKSNL